jgi:hypothetical protein
MAISAERVATRLANLQATVDQAKQAIKTHTERLKTSQAKLDEAQAELEFWKTHPAASKNGASSA